nr:MAG TPA_asm: hypothetical protein [Caudoviricetes sp.]
MVTKDNLAIGDFYLLAVEKSLLLISNRLFFLLRRREFNCHMISRF